MRSSIGRLCGIGSCVICSSVFATEAAQAQCYANDHEKLIAPDGAEGDEFGVSVAMASDTMVVGSWFDDDNGPWSGSAYAYRREGLEWHLAGKILAPDGEAGDLFGTAVAVDAGHILVGSPLRDFSPGHPNAGAVYVYRFVDGDYRLADTLTAGRLQTRAWFGRSVAVRGTLAVVGAPLYDDPTKDQEKDHGAVYVFREEGDAWQLEATLMANVPQNASEFGTTVSVIGPPGEELILVGSPYWDPDERTPDSGVACLFRRRDAAWRPEAILLANDGNAEDMFGSALALGEDETGEYAVVGAFGDDDVAEDGGAAYVFHHVGSRWIRDAKLTAADGVAGDWFGTSVALAPARDGMRAIIGADREDHTCSDSGSAYVFQRDVQEEEWFEASKMFASVASEDARFGTSLAAAGNWAVVGAAQDGALDDRAGAVHLFVNLSQCTVPQKRIHVDWRARGGDGRTWELAFTNLSDALAVAEPGDRIVVADGTYTPATYGGDRTATFSLASGVTILGGYEGYCGPHPDRRHPETHPTILSGDLNRDDGFDFSRMEDNSFHVITGSGTDETAVLDRVIITGGHADDPDFGPGGGGMFNVDGHPTIINCRFEGNLTTNRTANPDLSFGGGAMMNIASSPTILNCTFVRNAARRATSGEELSCGGAMYNTADSQPFVKDCLFFDNFGDDGGAMCNEDDGHPLVVDSVFRENRTKTSRDGGGMYNGIASHPDLIRCVFEANTAGWGGAIRNQDDSAPLIADSLFLGNTATANGGAILNYNRCSPTIRRCFFFRNAGRDGGCVANGAESSPQIDNCSFVQCIAENNGGALSNYLQSNPSVTNCTVAGNTANSVGGIMSWDDSVASITNTILWQNEDQRGFVERAQVWVSGEGILGVDYSCVMGWTGTYDGEGIIAEDPLLTRVFGDEVNMRLLPDSPAINAGDPEYVPDPGTRDFDGLIRRLCGRVDMGAHEFGLGDLDCDRDVDLEDYEGWMDCVTGPGGGPYADGCESLDFDADDDVDLADFAGMQMLLPGPE